MGVKLNHHIVWSRDQRSTARFFADMLGLPAPTEHPPFTTVRLANEILLDFLSTDGEVSSQHYAFLVTEPEFDEIYARIIQNDLRFWAGPGHHAPNRINTRDGGRGVYFDDPNGHALEVITRPYGSGSPG
jgi:catechol 2,3-dioxygenase-like lactoylglutathione lyase family enzyme